MRAAADPTTYTDERVGGRPPARRVEAVIDSDLASAPLAIDLNVDVLAIVTDVDAVYEAGARRSRRDCGRRRKHSPSRSSPPAPWAESVRAACEFVERTGKPAVIGSITDTGALIRGEAGTVVALDARALSLGVA